MSISKVIFAISDYTNHPRRNYKRYPQVVREKDIVFGAYGNDTALDIYYPKDYEGKLPVLVNVHGGGYVRGDKRFRSGIANFFASHGWFVVNTNYRLAPKATFPAATEDTLNALNYINNEDFVNKYPIDLSRLVVSGDSAGGYYAAHSVASATNSELQEKLNLPKYEGAKVTALLTFCAPYDLMKCFTKKTPLNVTVDITNSVFGTSYKTNEIDDTFMYTDEVNVLAYLTKDFPKTLSIAAVNDGICGGQLDGAISAFEKAGISHDFYLMEEKGDGHCTHLLPFKKGTKPVMEKVIEFLESVKNG
ncbi:MAG: alpha/beta hydrolase [Firmicutes bacterium]|nr:alpha/beta hydrolase [Bacillota bacterium]